MEYLKQEDSFKLKGLEVYWQINYSSKFNISDNLELYIISKKILLYAEKLNLPIEECRYRTDLEIYLIPEQVLNDQQYFGWEKPNQKILGLFEPLADRQTSVIVVSVEKTYDPKILVHELGHYWYHRLCWDLYSSRSSESIAQELENKI